MRSQDNRGFSKAELIVCLCAILVLFAFGVKILSDNNSNSSFTNFKRQAETFAYRVSIYKDINNREDNTYYLDYLIDGKHLVDLVNPFDTNVECDRYESFVKMEGTKKIVTLKCGNYVIVGSEGEEYTIYELSEWSENANDGEAYTLYNYKKDGVLMSNDYMIEKAFIDFYNNKESSRIDSLSEIEDDAIEIVTKVMYRSMKVVKTLK